MNQDTRAYPRMMYHPDLPAQSVKDEAARTAILRRGFSDTYQHQEYPKAVYHADEDPKTVTNPTELAAALADGWTLEYEHRLVPQKMTSPITGEEITLPPNKNGLKVARSPGMPAPKTDAPKLAQRGDIAEFPRTVYRLNEEPKKVANQEELQAALADGWKLLQPVSDEKKTKK